MTISSENSLDKLFDDAEQLKIAVSELKQGVTDLKAELKEIRQSLNQLHLLKEGKKSK